MHCDLLYSGNGSKTKDLLNRNSRGLNSGDSFSDRLLPSFDLVILEQERLNPPESFTALHEKKH